ncbi:hypothetical protein [Sphingobium sp. CCH11-B1]|uniref:hypothetical protein n=1 Tax=Sphingobium sp. CCH11-B1 TaxID=1768781 RepID=UPI00083717E9|nr:hypothetical protein [Sphingobium sp. CCH11-B1]
MIPSRQEGHRPGAGRALRTAWNWSFRRDGEEIDVEVKGPVALHDHELMIETALAGVALA